MAHTVATTTYEAAFVAVISPPQPIKIDASTPAAVDTTGSTSLTVATASFSPPANSTVVVGFGIEFDTGETSAPTVSCADSLSNSYGAGPSAYDGQAGGCWLFSHYYASAPGSITVTVTRSSQTSDTALLDLAVLVRTVTSIAAEAAATVSRAIRSYRLTGG